MSSLSLSEAERTFVIHGVQDDLRADGRHRDDFRHLELETGVVSNTNGSCRLRLGETDLLVGVKAELGEPLPSTPKHGRLEFFVDCRLSLSNVYTLRTNLINISSLIPYIFPRNVFSFAAPMPLPSLKGEEETNLPRKSRIFCTTPYAPLAPLTQPSLPSFRANRLKK